MAGAMSQRRQNPQPKRSATMKTKRYQATVIHKNRPPIHPIVEAVSPNEARRILEAQYPDATFISGIMEVK